MVERDAGIAAMEADGEDLFRAAGAVAAPHRSFDAVDPDVVADTRSDEPRIARQRRPGNAACECAECGTFHAAKLAGARIGVGDRDEAFDHASLPANRDGVPRTGAFVSAFLHRPARMREVGDARGLYPALDATNETVRAIGSGEARAPGAGGFAPGRTASAVASKRGGGREQDADRGSGESHLRCLSRLMYRKNRGAARGWSRH
jgi:hypothetical protein